MVYKQALMSDIRLPATVGVSLGVAGICVLTGLGVGSFVDGYTDEESPVPGVRRAAELGAILGAVVGCVAGAAAGFEIYRRLS